MGCDQRVGSAERVAGVAGPGIVGRVGDHPCANGIELDVTQALQEVCFGIDRARLVAPLPQRARAVIAVIDVPDVTPTEGLHHACDGAGRRRRYQQVHVIGHQHVAMDGAALA